MDFIFYRHGLHGSYCFITFICSFDYRMPFSTIVPSFSKYLKKAYEGVDNSLANVLFYPIISIFIEREDKELHQNILRRKMSLTLKLYVIHTTYDMVSNNTLYPLNIIRGLKSSIIYSWGQAWILEKSKQLDHDIF